VNGTGSFCVSGAHATWHTLCSLTAGMLYLYYQSEGGGEQKYLILAEEEDDVYVV